MEALNVGGALILLLLLLLLQSRSAQASRHLGDKLCSVRIPLKNWLLQDSRGAGVVAGFGENEVCFENLVVSALQARDTDEITRA